MSPAVTAVMLESSGSSRDLERDLFSSSMVNSLTLREDVSSAAEVEV